MRGEISGNLKGLKPSQQKGLERIFRRRVAPDIVITPELATFLCELSLEFGRQLGLLINRRGSIEHIMVGDAQKLMLPDVGRLRGAPGRFRGLRLVHTHLHQGGLDHDDLTDLALLRLDMVAAIDVVGEGLPGDIHIGHLLPDNPDEPADQPMWALIPSQPLHGLELDFREWMAALEAEFSRKAPVGQAHDETTQALIVHVDLVGSDDSDARVLELRELCRTAGARVLDVIIQTREAADPKFLVGRGKLEQILLRAMQLGAETLIFDPDLSPGQARAISEFTELKIIDRTMLILDIFAQHARSGDGKLQVELAQLRYALPRLVQKNTMMSRLTGGIGGRGPGETKLEVSRRRARERITLLESKRVAAAKSRRLRRKQRKARAVPIIGIVGYTNAGKSTLLNALTDSDADAANKLFATLEPISRRMRFPREREVVLTDTVGFIRDLPADLVAAFRATLEELDEADLLIHVVDGSSDEHERQLDAVGAILTDLSLAEKPRLLVFNKADKLDPEEAQRRAEAYGAIPLSAQQRSTFDPLLAAIERELWKEDRSAS